MAENTTPLAGSTAAAPKFTKEALQRSKQFEFRRDLVAAVLTDTKDYTIDEAEAAIAAYLGREVK